MTPTRMRHNWPHRAPHRSGFTLIEIMGVIAVIAILASMLFPVFARSRERARQSSCAINLLNIGLALRTYAAEHDDLLPPVENDLGPLHPKYVSVSPVFRCPSEPDSGLRMGFPLPDPPQPEPPGPDAMGGPGVPPGGPPPGMMMPGEEMEGPPDAYTDLLETGYCYGAGHDLRSAPARWLCSDATPLHNDGANVLFTDGAIKWIPAVQWKGMGFPSARPFEGSSAPGDHLGMGGMPPGPPPGPPGGG